MHYIASLSSNRVIQTEYRKYCGDEFEIQIRSILQHAWAEIEHDLGYKSEAAIPRDIRRRFSRLAGLLEIADDEFLGIRNALALHQESASTIVNSGQLEIEIDQDSLYSFVESDERIRELDRAITDMLRGGILVEDFKRSYIGQQAERLTLLGFHSIKDLSTFLNEQESLLKEFAHKWLDLTIPKPTGGANIRVVPRGITFYYIGLFKYAQKLLRNEPYKGVSFENISDDFLKEALKAAERELRNRS